MISTAFAHHLREMRTACNRQFHDARLQYPHLDATRFMVFLEHYADALVTAITDKKPQAARHVASTVYQHGLHLAGLNWVSAANDHHGGLAHLATAWRRYLPDIITAYTEHTQEVLVMIAHALHQFSLHPGSRPEQWLQRIYDVMSACPHFSLWKQAGQVLAWQSGLAHYRDSALAIADRLPAALTLQLVEAPTTLHWLEASAHFRQNPWWRPHATGTASRQAMPVQEHMPVQEQWRVGGFVEFGGAFHQPPQVTLHEGQWLVKSGDDLWLLLADAYGATLHRLGVDEARGATFKNPAGKTVGVSGQHINYAQSLFSLTDIESIGSWAYNDTTLLVCSADTFAVIVLSLQPPATEAKSR